MDEDDLNNFKDLFQNEFAFGAYPYSDIDVGNAWNIATVAATRKVKRLALYYLTAHFLFMNTVEKEDQAVGLTQGVETLGGQGESYTLADSYKTSQFENQLAQTKFGKTYLMMVKAGLRLRLPTVIRGHYDRKAYRWPTY